MSKSPRGHPEVDPRFPTPHIIEKRFYHTQVPHQPDPQLPPPVEDAVAPLPFQFEAAF